MKTHTHISNFCQASMFLCVENKQVCKRDVAFSEWFKWVIRGILNRTPQMLVHPTVLLPSWRSHTGSAPLFNLRIISEVFEPERHSTPPLVKHAYRKCNANCFFFPAFDWKSDPDKIQIHAVITSCAACWHSNLNCQGFTCSKCLEPINFPAHSTLAAADCVSNHLTNALPTSPVVAYTRPPTPGHPIP